MNRLFRMMIGLVILTHVIFAGMQAFAWPFVAERLLSLTNPDTILRTANVGTSFASYNFSIGLGLGLSFLLGDSARHKVQITVLALIVFTAIVGYLGTESTVILLGRLLPAAVALLTLLSISRRS